MNDTGLATQISVDNIVINYLPDGFVYITDLCPSIKVNLKYASSDNFTGRPVRGYETNKAILTGQAASKLCNLQLELEQQGFGLLIWDAYRPIMAVEDFMLWGQERENEIIKNRFHPKLTKNRLFEIGLIAPNLSSHNRGSTVDLTIVNLNTGKPLNMGTEFDYFDEISYTNSSNISQEAKDNRNFLVAHMEKYDFVNFPKEWWHFTMCDEPYPEIYFNFFIK